MRALPKLSLGRALLYHKPEGGCIYVNNAEPWNAIKYLLYMLATLNKPHNGRLAALFPEVTHAEFVRRELECIIGFDGEEI